MRHHRERLSLTQAQLAERLGYATDAISRVETGQIAPSGDFARDCDTLFETHGALLRLALRVNRQAGLPRWAREWFETEQEAHTLRKWQPLLVDGLLQTEEYARELLRGHPGSTDEQVEQQTGARMERQAILDRDKPPRLWVVLHENALL